MSAEAPTTRKSLAELCAGDVDDIAIRLQDATRALRMFTSDLPIVPDEYSLRSLRLLVDAIETEANIMPDNWLRFREVIGMGSTDGAA